MVPLAVALALIAQPSFTISVTPVYAMEGGPVVVEIQVVSAGRCPVEVIMQAFIDDAIRVEPPPEWVVTKAPDNRIFRFGADTHQGTYAPGQHVLRTRITLHRMFTGDIPPGDATVRLGWSAWLVGSGRVVRASACVTVGVERRSPESIARLAGAISQAARRVVAANAKDPHERLPDEDAVTDAIADTAHPELVPAAMSLMDAPLQQPNRRALRRYVLSFPEGCERLDGWDAARIATGTHPDACLLAREWAAREPGVTNAASLLPSVRGVPRRPVSPTPMATEHVVKLMRSRSIWLRSLVVARFADRLTPGEVSATLGELRQRVAPVGRVQLEAWLAGLDAPSFADREAAETAFSRHFEQAHQFLLARTGKIGSPEAARRVDQILAAGDKQHDLFEDALVAGLSSGSVRTRAARERVMAILRAGDPAFRSVQAFNVALECRSDRCPTRDATFGSGCTEAPMRVDSGPVPSSEWPP